MSGESGNRSALGAEIPQLDGRVAGCADELIARQQLECGDKAAVLTEQDLDRLACDQVPYSNCSVPGATRYFTQSGFIH